MVWCGVAPLWYSSLDILSCAILKQFNSQPHHISTPDMQTGKQREEKERAKMYTPHASATSSQPEATLLIIRSVLIFTGALVVDDTAMCVPYGDLGNSNLLCHFETIALWVAVLIHSFIHSFNKRANGVSRR